MTWNVKRALPVLILGQELRSLGSSKEGLRSACGQRRLGVGVGEEEVVVVVVLVIVVVVAVVVVVEADVGVTVTVKMLVTVETLVVMDVLVVVDILVVVDVMVIVDTGQVDRLATGRLEIVDADKELGTCDDDAEDLEEEPIVVVLVAIASTAAVVVDELGNTFEYTFSRYPAPHICALFPGHGKLHSVNSVFLLPSLKLFPQ